MRVIGGVLRSRRLRTPRGMGTRPTADRVRESVFNVLASAVIDASVLDLFAGSGALGIEALSRGAAKATFVESNRAASRVLAQNIAALGLADKASVCVMPVAKALPQLAATGARFNLVFIDPPYGRNEAPDALAALVQAGLPAAEATVVVEHERSAELPSTVGDAPTALTRIRVLSYGDTSVSLYRATNSWQRCQQ